MSLFVLRSFEQGRPGRDGALGIEVSRLHQHQFPPPNPLKKTRPHAEKCFTSHSGAKRVGAADFYLPETLEPWQPRRIKAYLAYFRFRRLKLNGIPADL